MTSRWSETWLPNCSSTRKPVERRVHARMRDRNDGPYPAAVLLPERDIGRRRGEDMIVDREAHGLPEAHAAQQREPVHAVGRDVESQAGLEGEARIAQQPVGVLVAFDDLAERDARIGRGDVALGKFEAAQRFPQRHPLHGECVHRRGKLGRREKPVRPDRGQSRFAPARSRVGRAAARARDALPSRHFRMVIGSRFETQCRAASRHRPAAGKPAATPCPGRRFRPQCQPSFPLL